MTKPKRVYSQLPESLRGKDLDNLTPQEEADFEAFVDSIYEAIAAGSSRPEPVEEDD